MKIPVIHALFAQSSDHFCTLLLLNTPILETQYTSSQKSFKISTTALTTTKVFNRPFINSAYGNTPCPNLSTFLVILICAINGLSLAFGAEAETRRMSREVYCRSLTHL